MFQLVKDELRKGFAYVRDYVGNTWYYGPVKECKEFISEMEAVIQNASII